MRFLRTPKRMLELHLRTNTDYVLLHKSVFQSLTHWKLYCWGSINRQTLIQLTAVNSVSLSKKNGQTTNVNKVKTYRNPLPTNMSTNHSFFFPFFPSCIIQTSRHFFYSSCFSACFLFFLLVSDYFPYFRSLMFIFRSLFPFLTSHICSAELPVPIRWIISSTVRSNKLGL